MNLNSVSNFLPGVSPHEELVLIQALTLNDKVTCSKFYNDYSDALYTIINKIIRHDQDAEDLLQETFIKILLHLASYDASKSRLFTWMARIAKNNAIDYLRTNQFKLRHNTVDVKILEEENYEHYYVTYNNIETIGVRKLLVNLSSSQREIIDLLYFSGFTHSQVAIYLQIPLGTVKSRTRAAIIALRMVFRFDWDLLQVD